ncbi:hypothetical protein BHM03_00001649 [Ensete ventricosum]|nr:hypothetical protein BHM03_00001649 [Ensete ventricosum]
MYPIVVLDKGHMYGAARTGTLGSIPYRVFSMEELQEATNGFDPSNLLEDSARGQVQQQFIEYSCLMVYKGHLQDGSLTTVRSLRLNQKFSPQSLPQYLDLISKLRHHHLASILGHCIFSSQDGSNTTTMVFLVSEHVTNGTLRSHITVLMLSVAVEWRKREMLKWPQRLAAVTGIARGIQFLHTAALLTEFLFRIGQGGCERPFVAADDRDLGRIQLIHCSLQIQKTLTDSPSDLKGIADPSIRGTYAVDSLRTAIEISLNCASRDPNQRPSIDDVLWNLQYSAQIQDGWASSENLSIQV